MKRYSLGAGIAVLGLSISQFASAFAADVPVYMETVVAGASLSVAATSGDRFGDYVLPGVPDGIGAIKSGSAVELYMNQEISATASNFPRVNGTTTGSTISKLTLDSSTLKVTSASEAIKKLTWYDYRAKQYGQSSSAPIGASEKDPFGTPLYSKALNRFCSSSLAQPGTLLFKSGKKAFGYDGAVYFTGEEGGDDSRFFALDVKSGELVHLPKLGLGAWENGTLVPTKNRTTALILNEDGSATDSQLFMYVGQKSTKGRWYEKAGLTNGTRYVMKIANYAKESEFRAAVAKGVPAEISFTAVDTDLNGRVQNQLAALAGTSLARIEDGMFDPNSPNDYYFLTTESNKDPKATQPNPESPSIKRDGGALWRLRFRDASNPLAGASITMLLDGSEPPYLNKPDNLTVDRNGNILIQEDPGNNDHVSRLVSYRLSDGKIAVIARFKAAYFDPANKATYMTSDEESSGVLDLTTVLRRSAADTASYFVLNAQVHVKPSIARPDIADASQLAAIDAAAVEGGQLYILKIADWSQVYSG